MGFLIAMKSSFLPDFVQLDRNTQKSVKFALAELEDKPVTPRSDKIKRLKYHERLWRYRLGDLRLVYAAYPERKLVQLISIGHRSDVYDRLGYQPDEPEYDDYSLVLEQALDPEGETPPEWLQYIQPPEDETHQRALPYRLTPERLNQWLIPENLHYHFLGCETEEDLISCGAPDNYIYHIIDCLWPPSANELVDDPNYVLQKADDLERYAQGSLRAFLLLLDSDQEKFVDWALQGPTLVKGGPGSGKSTVALYRVRALIESAAKKQETIKVLFTTYTNALIGFSKQLIDYLLEDVDHPNIELEVTTLDTVARRIVKDCEGWPDMAVQADLSSALTSGRASFLSPRDSADRSRKMYQALGALRDDYLQEEIEWVIHGQGLNTLEEYLRADRTGRGYAFDQRMRETVWAFYESYRNFLTALSKTSWAELRKKAFDCIIAGSWADDKWDFVIVDEAQDLTPIALALCVELCKSPKGLFLTADASQSIYNKGFAWKNVHESMQVIGRTRILRRNYRTTRQIARAAGSMLVDTGAGDEEALDQVYVHVGPKPIIYQAQDEREGYLWLANHINQSLGELHLPASAAAVLSPQKWMAEQAAESLTSLGLSASFVTGKNINLLKREVKTMTIHSSKGLEFPVVGLIYVEEGFMPYTIRDSRVDDLDKHLEKERRVLFVGMTRAMRRLFVVHRRGRGSSFLRDIDHSLWDTEQFS